MKHTAPVILTLAFALPLGGCDGTLHNQLTDGSLDAAATLDAGDAGRSLPDAAPPDGGCGCLDPAKPYCQEGTCVACRDGADCQDQALPLCLAGVCTAAPACGEGAKPASYTWPVPAVHTIGQKFGNVIAYMFCKYHTGIDVSGADGTPLVAIAPGKVVHVGYMWYNGTTTGRGPYAVILQHAPNFYSTYGHNRKALVQIGDCVTEGQTVAEMGNLGYSGGPHLHFEIVDGLPFTGEWQEPFDAGTFPPGDATSPVCKAYQDPEDHVTP